MESRFEEQWGEDQGGGQAEGAPASLHQLQEQGGRLGLFLEEKSQIESSGGDCSGCSEGHCSGASPTRGWGGEETSGGFSAKLYKSLLTGFFLQTGHVTSSVGSGVLGSALVAGLVTAGPVLTVGLFAGTVLTSVSCS